LFVVQTKCSKSGYGIKILLAPFSVLVLSWIDSSNWWIDYDACWI